MITLVKFLKNGSCLLEIPRQNLDRNLSININLVSQFGALVCEIAILSNIDISK